MYTYIPNDHSYAIMQNDKGANITLSGEESYGMKFASKAEPRASMINNGTITLQKILMEMIEQIIQQLWQ